MAHLTRRKFVCVVCFYSALPAELLRFNRCSVARWDKVEKSSTLCKCHLTRCESQSCLFWLPQKQKHRVVLKQFRQLGPCQKQTANKAFPNLRNKHLKGNYRFVVCNTAVSSEKNCPIVAKCQSLCGHIHASYLSKFKAKWISSSFTTWLFKQVLYH